MCSYKEEKKNEKQKEQSQFCIFMLSSWLVCRRVESEEILDNKNISFGQHVVGAF